MAEKSRQTNNLVVSIDPVQFQIKTVLGPSKKKQKKQNIDSSKLQKTKEPVQIQQLDQTAPESHNQTKVLNLQFSGPQQSPFKDIYGQVTQMQQSYANAMIAQRHLQNLMQQNFNQFTQDRQKIQQREHPAQLQQFQGAPNQSPQKRNTTKAAINSQNQSQNLFVINQIQLKNSGYLQAQQQQQTATIANAQKLQNGTVSGLTQNGKTQSRTLVSSVAPPEKGNLYNLIDEYSYEPVILLPPLLSQTQQQQQQSQAHPRSSKKEKRKTDSSQQQRRKISQSSLINTFHSPPEQTLFQKNQQVILIPQGIVMAAPNTVKKQQSAKFTLDQHQKSFTQTVGAINPSQQQLNYQQHQNHKFKQQSLSNQTNQTIQQNSSQGFQQSKHTQQVFEEALNKQQEQHLAEQIKIKQSVKTKATCRQSGAANGLSDDLHHILSVREHPVGLQSSNSGNLRQPVGILETTGGGGGIIVIPPSKIQFQSSENQQLMKKQNSHASTQSVDGILTVLKVKKNEPFTQETGDAISQEKTNDHSDSKDDSLSIQFKRARFETSKPAREALISNEDLDDDEHFDDAITDSEHTDNEMQNNLQSFKPNKDIGPIIDSDADSDAGNSSYRFSLNNNTIQDRTNNQNSDNESDTDNQFNKRGRNPAYRDEPDDIGIDDISEHSSDEVDSDSDEVCTPMQKQIKKEKKRKKRKMEAIKKAQAAAKGEKGNGKETKLESKKTDKGAGKEKEKQKKESSKDNNQQKKDKPKQKAPEQTVKQIKQKESQMSIPEESPVKKKKKEKEKKQNMQALMHTLPKNIEEQEEIFFQSGCSVNPQFEYDNFETTQKFLLQYKDPSEDLMPIAVQIMNSFLETYGSESAYLASEGSLVSQEDTERIFMDYINELEFGDQLILNFQVRQVAPTSVTHDPKTGKSKVNIRLPCEYRRGRIMGVIDHEIGTHFLRRNNEKFQVWCKKRDKYEVKNCMKTEEGFACTNQLVRQALQPDGYPYLYRSALNYYTAYKASKMSFVDLFNDIEKYIDDKMSRWKFVLRVKRGVMDTSEPGGLYKDQVYLEGAVAILRERKTLDFYGLCCGKISMEDMKRLSGQKKLKKEQIKIPPFMRDMEQYMRALDIIARVNHVDDYVDQQQRLGTYTHVVNDQLPMQMKTLQVADDFDNVSDDFD